MRTFSVYAIRNRKTGDAYVGSSFRTARRWKEHQWALINGHHACPALLAAWNEHGPEAFEFVVIWTIFDANKAAMVQSELFWIDKVGTYNAVGADLERGKFVLPQTLKEALGERNRTRQRQPKYRDLAGEHSKRRWEDLFERAKLMDAPKRGKHHIKGMPSVKSPEQWADHSEKMKTVWADPERRQKLEARRAARWADPEAKARQGEKMRAYHAARRARLPGV